MSLALPAGEIHLWQVATDLAIGATQERRLLAELAPAERERHARFRFARDRRQYLFAHVLLRRTLSCYAPRPPQSWTFVANAYGKPALAGEGPHFNLSHAEGMVVCALAHGVRLGVDVERQDRRVDWKGLADRWLAPEEREWLGRQPEDARATAFLRLWTLKEAYAKAFGLGLAISLTGFAIGISADGSAWVRRQGPAVQVAADESIDDREASCTDVRCQVEHWQLKDHWLGLVALLAPGEVRPVVVRRDGGPLLGIA